MSQEVKGLVKKGVVVKKSGEKTVKVQVTESRTHPKYHKQYKVTNHFLVHDEDGVAKIDDNVLIQQCRPVSKNKSWMLASDK